MPISSEGQKVLDNMRKEYGPDKGEQVFYATANAKKKVGYGSGKWHAPKKSTRSKV